MLYLVPQGIKEHKVFSTDKFQHEGFNSTVGSISAKHEDTNN